MLKSAQNECSAVMTRLRERLETVRVGRAHPGLVDHILVDYYGAPTALRELGTISAPEPNQILVEPWDGNALEAIEKALHKADLGTSPVVEGQRIRITLPPLTEERRREFVKKLHAEMEQSRIAVRTVREKCWKTVQDEEESGAISEDEKFRQKERLQEIVDETNRRIDELGKQKEEQLMKL